MHITWPMVVFFSVLIAAAVVLLVTHNIAPAAGWALITGIAGAALPSPVFRHPSRKTDKQPEEEK